MTYQEVIEKIKPDFQNFINAFKTEVMKIRTSHLSPSFIEDIRADCFGQELPLKQLGAISSVSNRELVIQLWDKSYAEGVVKAIERENLGLGIRTEENSVYLTAPSLTEESRKGLVQLLHKKQEETFQNFRRLRDKAWKEIQDKCESGEIREDDKFRGRDKLDDLMRDHREKIEEMAEKKEKEILG